MSSINLTGNETGSSRKRAGVRRMLKHSLKVDMTPMVDLGFLLITFFVITTELAKPTAMDLYMPKDGIDMPLGESNALTVLIDNDRMYYYNGAWQDAVKSRNIIETNSVRTGLQKVIGDKQRQLDIINKTGEGRDGLMLLVKPTNEASYKMVVDVLDEATISIVKKYAIVKLSDDERTWLKNNWR